MGQVDCSFNTRARAGFGVDDEFSTDQVKSFTHTNQSESRSWHGDVWREADSVIGDAEMKEFRSSMHLYIDLGGSAMFRDVAQRLLHNTKQAE